MLFTGKEVAKLAEKYALVREEIEKRIQEFKRVWERGSEEDLFSELAFCLLTPQSKAEICWSAVEALRDDGTLFNGSLEEIAERLNGVRFRKQKALYIIEARESFKHNGVLSLRSSLTRFKDAFAVREWLVKKVRGMGYKEASHFLRNIGKGDSLAILDRHVLRSMIDFKIIDEIPNSISKKRYLLLEEKLRRFSNRIGIPLVHLDFVFWFERTGRIFK
ncbi:MAG: N-glycosylase/DNA lyase [Synergistetes bacterium]|nr:N-glycosylase/DNA lyase [Synergistota bacterium]